MSDGMIQMRLDERKMRELARLSRRFPKETRRGMGRAGASLRGKLRKVMRKSGGIEGVPAFEPRDPDTLELGELKPDFINKLGGKLTKAYAIQMFNKTKSGFTVGFITALEPYARAFQVAETRVLTTGERIHFARSFVDAALYNRPARPVLAPFERAARRDLIAWAIRNTEKILEDKKN